MLCAERKMVAIQYYKSNSRDTFKTKGKGGENNTRASCQRKTQQGKEWSVYLLFEGVN